MRIRRFRARNFRSIGERELVLDDLQPIEVLHGPTNAGKSNVLLGMRACFALLKELRSLVRQPEIVLSDAERLGPWMGVHGTVRPWDLPGDVVTELGLELVDPDVSMRFEIRWEPTRVKLAHLERDGRVLAFAADPHELVDDPDGRADLVSEAMAGVEPDEFLLIDAQRRPRDAGSWDIVCHKLRLSGREADRRKWYALHDAVGQFADVLGPGELTTLLDDRGHPALAWEHHVGARRVPEPLTEQGAGVQQLVHILAAVLCTDADVVAVEEPEVQVSARLQPRLFDALARAVAQGSRQLVLTSHSAAFDRARHLWKVERDETGHTTAERGRRTGSPEAYATFEEELRQLAASAGAGGASWVTSEGAVLLPEVVQKAAGLSEGDLLFFFPGKDRLVVQSDLQLERELTRDDGA